MNNMQRFSRKHIFITLGLALLSFAFYAIAAATLSTSTVSATSPSAEVDVYELEDGQKPDILEGELGDPGSSNQAGQAEAGVAVADDNAGNENIDTTSSNTWVLVVGIVLIVLAVLLSGAWLVSRSRMKEEDFASETEIEDFEMPAKKKATSKTPKRAGRKKK